MIDLFLPPTIRKRAVSYVHRIEPDEELGDLPTGKARKERRSAAQQRRWHIANRKRRLAKMKARYEANKQEYIDRAKKWRQENRERYNVVHAANQRRRRAKQRLVAARTRPSERGDRIIKMGGS